MTAHLRVLGWDVCFLHSVVMFAVGGRSDLKDNLPYTFSQRDTNQTLYGLQRPSGLSHMTMSLGIRKEAIQGHRSPTRECMCHASTHNAYANL